MPAARTPRAAPTTGRRRSGERLRVYREKTAPLVGFYRERGLLADVDGVGRRRRGRRRASTRPSTSGRRARGRGVITIRSQEELLKLEEASRIVLETLDVVEKAVAPGVTTDELDRIAEAEIRRRGAQPAFLGYRGYPKTLCTSSTTRSCTASRASASLQEGDIVGIDCGAVVGRLLTATRRGRSRSGRSPPRPRSCSRSPAEALRAGIAAARPGGRVSDIGAAVEAVALVHGYGVVREFVGHGVGTALHEEPQVPNYGPAGRGEPAEGRNGAGDRADVQPRPGRGLASTRTAGRCARATGRRRRTSSTRSRIEPHGAVILGTGSLSALRPAAVGA